MIPKVFNCLNKIFMKILAVNFDDCYVKNTKGYQEENDESKAQFFISSKEDLHSPSRPSAPFDSFVVPRSLPNKKYLELLHI